MMAVTLKVNKPTAMSIKYVPQKMSIREIAKHKMANGRAKRRPEIPDDFGFSFCSSLQPTSKSNMPTGTPRTASIQFIVSLSLTVLLLPFKMVCNYLLEEKSKRV